MSREFNITGTCIPHMHYMVDIDDKIVQISKLVEKGLYFTINRPRQYGKTTTMYMLERKISRTYVVIRISFEGVGDALFDCEDKFCGRIVGLFADALEYVDKSLAEILRQLDHDLQTLDQVSQAISKFIIQLDKKVVLMIDEVDKSVNNQLFLSFLGMLRNKYLMRNEGKDHTFYSVILAGVHDVKTLKLKLGPDAERKYNSPWNIAIDFKVEMSFSPKEIATMLRDYSNDKNTNMDILGISERIHYFTAGHPFLVSKLCKIIDEDIIIKKGYNEWSINDVDTAVNILTRDNNTNFDSLIVNLENNSELYNVVFDIIINGIEKGYNLHNPIIKLGETYGIFKEEESKLKIHNKIYEQLMYNYMSSKIELTTDMSNHNFKGNFICDNGELDFMKLLLKFQGFMKEQYSEKDDKFLERNGRLLFLAFIKPVINGKGFDFKEVQISQEKRLDVVVTYLDKRYVVELKRWDGQKAHEKGMGQLAAYLDGIGVDVGYLIIFDFSKPDHKQWKHEKTFVNDKEIFMIWV